MAARFWTKAGVTVSAAVVATLSLAGPAAASCAQPPPMEQAIEDAETVFAGTVRALADEGYRATVEVHEIWKGPDLPPVVEVSGTGGGRQGDQVVRTSVDRTYTMGTRYLFVLYDREPPLDDNVCNSTTEWREDLSEHRPADARQPVEGGGSQGSHGGEVTTTGGDSGAQEPTMTGTGPDTPVSSDGAPGSGGSGDAAVDDGREPAGEGAPENGAEPISTRVGLAAPLLVVILAGVPVLLLGGWWLRRDG